METGSVIYQMAQRVQQAGSPTVVEHRQVGGSGQYVVTGEGLEGDGFERWQLQV